MGQHAQTQAFVDRVLEGVPAPVRRVASISLTVLMLGICLLGVAILALGLFIPQAMGALGYAVMTGSMSPTYPPGTLVVVQPADSYVVGDVITYQRYSLRPEVVTHRIVGLTHRANGQTAYITQGDANSSADSEAVRPIQVRGKVRYSVPYLGHIATWLNTAQRTIFMYLVVGALGIYAIVHIVHAARVKDPLDTGSVEEHDLGGLPGTPHAGLATAAGGGQMDKYSGQDDNHASADYIGGRDLGLNEVWPFEHFGRRREHTGPNFIATGDGDNSHGSAAANGHFYMTQLPDAPLGEASVDEQWVEE